MALKTAERKTKRKRSTNDQPAIGLHSAGMLLTPKEFDAIDDYDNCYHYELINGVLVVSPIPVEQQADLNDVLGQELRNYQDHHPKGSHLDKTLPERYIRVHNGRRLVDRAIWAGLGRLPDFKKDPATIAVEIVSEGRRDRERDYVEKKKEYREAGVQQYWIIDRFARTMTVHDFRGKRTKTHVVKEDDAYESALLPGFVVPLKRLFEIADRYEKK